MQQLLQQQSKRGFVDLIVHIVLKMSFAVSIRLLKLQDMGHRLTIFQMSVSFYSVIVSLCISVCIHCSRHVPFHTQYPSSSNQRVLWLLLFAVMTVVLAHICPSFINFTM